VGRKQGVKSCIVAPVLAEEAANREKEEDEVWSACATSEGRREAQVRPRS